MIFIILVCIFGASLNLQVEACGSISSLNKIKNTIGVTANNVTDFINHLKVNLNLHLIDMVMNETFKAAAITKDIVSHIDNRQYGSQKFMLDLINATITACIEFQECINNKSNVMESIEKENKRFFNDGKSYLLKLSLSNVLRCIYETNQNITECANSNIKFTSSGRSHQYISDLQLLRISQESIKENSKLYAESAISDASLCIKTSMKKFNDTVDAVKKIIVRNHY